MKTMHLFAGVGGGLLADRILGHDPIIAVEWDRYACQVLRERAADGWFPNLRVWEGDVRLFNPSEYTACKTWRVSPALDDASSTRLAQPIK